MDYHNIFNTDYRKLQNQKVLEKIIFISHMIMRFLVVCDFVKILPGNYGKCNYVEKGAFSVLNLQSKCTLEQQICGIILKHVSILKSLRVTS